MKNTERFSNRVENYVLYRPHYPASIIEFLKQNAGLNKNHVIADIGSGTGILTELFLQNGNKTFGVEPNAAMRLKGEELLNNYKNFISINATAEATTLNDASVDLIIAGQAFHWFDREAFRRECRRIGRAGAYCLLMWNERKVLSDFEKAFEGLLLKYANDYQQVDHRNISEKDIQDFFAPEPVIYDVLYNEQVFDYEGVKGRLLSSSYAPNVGEPNHEPMIAHLHELFDRYQHDERVSFSYDCKLFFGQIL